MRSAFKWLWSTLVLKAPLAGTVEAGVDPLTIAKKLLLACKDCPPARGHVKEAMRSIFECQRETYDE